MHLRREICSLGSKFLNLSTLRILLIRCQYQAAADSEEASKLADEYQPLIISAENDKRASDMEFQKFAQATSEVCAIVFVVSISVCSDLSRT